jgi:hypothetical protein
VGLVVKSNSLLDISLIELTTVIVPGTPSYMNNQRDACGELELDRGDHPTHYRLSSCPSTFLSQLCSGVVSGVWDDTLGKCIPGLVKSGPLDLPSWAC